VSGLRSCPRFRALLTRLFWQTPLLLDFAKASKHLFILFRDGGRFRDAEHLDDVPVRAMKYDKRIGAVPPAPVLHEVTQFFWRWHYPANRFIGYIRKVVHHVRIVVVLAVSF
jgi:hypothetical protein